MIHEYSRRRFLIAGGSTALALPLLESLRPREVRAQAADEKIKRMVIVNAPNGVNTKYWTPSGEGENYDLGETLQEPWSPIKDDLLILHLDNQAARDSRGDPHGSGMAAMLSGHRVLPGTEFVHGAEPNNATGWGGGITVDQEMARRMQGVTHFPSLNFSIENHPANLWTRMSYSGPELPVTPQADPQRAFDDVFGAFMDDPEELQRKRERRLSILDGVRREIQALSPQLSQADRLRLEEHTSIVRQLEQSVSTIGGELDPACTFPERPELGLAPEVARYPGEPHRDVEKPDLDEEVPRRHELFREIMVRAMVCDLSRVVTLHTAPGNSYMVLSWTGVTIPHHGLSHMGADDKRAEKREVDKWYAGEFAKLVQMMKEATDPNGESLLANSVTLFTSEIGDNNSHNYEGKHHVIAGQGGGAFATGRKLNHPAGTKVNGLFVSMLNAMGFEDVTEFGDSDYNNGPLSGLSG